MNETQINTDWEEKRRRFLDLANPLLVAYLYLLAIFSPIMGLVLGIIAMKKCELEANRRLGKNVTIISAVMCGVMMLCIVGYVIFILIMVAAEKGGLSV